jgi:hypothetical protein
VIVSTVEQQEYSLVCLEANERSETSCKKLKEAVIRVYNWQLKRVRPESIKSRLDEIDDFNPNGSS